MARRKTFFEQIEPQENGCWFWTGSTNMWGYGQHKGTSAHRFSWELANGRKIAPKMCILHSCDNKGCVNPLHLREGTHKENTQDAIMRGNQGAKLTHIEVREIIKLLKESEYGYATLKTIARQFKVTWSTIYQIAKGNTWKHISRDEIQGEL